MPWSLLTPPHKERTPISAEQENGWSPQPEYFGEDRNFLPLLGSKLWTLYTIASLLF